MNRFLDVIEEHPLLSLTYFVVVLWSVTGMVNAIAY